MSLQNKRISQAQRQAGTGRDELISGKIQKILDESPYNDNFGVRRMQLALAQRGVLCGLRRLTRLMRLMRENGWLPKLTPTRPPV